MPCEGNILDCHRTDINKDKMNYAILAAGEGSRLTHEGEPLPKPLVRICGEAMIDRLIRIFMYNGAEHIAVITNDQTQLTSSHINGLKAQGLPISLKVKSTPSSMHSFYELHDMIGQGRFCLTTVDTIFPEDEFSQFIREFEQTDYDGLMAVTDYIDDEKPLYIDVDEELHIRGFNDTNTDERFISGGIYCLTDNVFPILRQCIHEGQSRMRNFQRALISSGLRLKAWPFSKIIDVDHRTDIAKAEELVNYES